ncbi:MULTISPECIES: Gfo/Idh/MocA family protein [Caldilinea]|jgi:predicted dehydrogenase|uniref:Putative oxidoreductase n=1 Tax=Caldilinea aerophila (strain DSM 14535 / JCM 11387 / NBRC 104270 / STL-6-O1) TaxID=926550 RepID=I0I8S3_CALAS|nr:MULTISPECIES: Gfo/Idh/MocA family oxidoreductase [Caldilinea]BAM01661.1 putative oxidoreductase [Caldilinea aerophila DSM 14535 = NBRC 104270]GIV72999.1 MAG: oxidoreductase [Caldilinea sp.]
MERTRIGLLGAGRMGRNHARVLTTLRYADLVGVYDPASEAAHRLAAQYDVAAFESFDALLEQVDAVSIATPTPTHYELVAACLERGLDVFVEKPFTETWMQAEALVALVQRTGQIVQVGHIERFNPAYGELKHVLENMSPLVVNFRRLSSYVGSNTDVDVVLDLMIHDLDLALDLAGADPLQIEADGFTVFSGAIDYANVTLKFAHWPLLTLTASRVTEQKVRSIDVTALEAYIESDLLNKSIQVHYRTVGEYVHHNHGGVKYRQESVVERIHVPIAEPLHAELEHFVHCVRTRQQPRVTAEHGLRTLRLAETIRELIQRRMLDARLEYGHAGSALAPDVARAVVA